MYNKKVYSRRLKANWLFVRGFELPTPATTGVLNLCRTTLEFRDLEENIAVAGRISSTKTSFINSCRGLFPGSPNPEGLSREYWLGETGNEETTQLRGRYYDKKCPTLAWWDMPGVGGQTQRESTFYNTHNLAAYQCTLLLHDQAFSQVSNF